MRRLLFLSRTRSPTCRRMMSSPAVTVDRVLPAGSDEKKLTLMWSDSTVTSFPYVYLLDNQPTAIGRRQKTTTKLASEVLPENIAFSPDRHVTITWTDARTSVYPISWLAERRQGVSNGLTGLPVKRKYWDAESFHERPKYDLRRLQTDDHTLLEMLLQLQSCGFVILENCGTQNEMRMELAKLVDGGIRPTYISGYVS